MQEKRIMRDAVVLTAFSLVMRVGAILFSMYLTKAIAEEKMTGVLPGSCFNTGKLTRFGYITLHAKKDNMLCAADGQIRGHEFHHWDCTENGTDFTATKRNGKTWQAVTANDHLYAGFPHFNFYTDMSLAENFLEACKKYKER